MTTTEKLKIAVQALEDIPISRFRRNLCVGQVLDGVMAVQLANDPAFLKDIAREALGKIK